MFHQAPLHQARLALATYQLYRDPSRLENFFKMVDAAAPRARLEDVASTLCHGSPAFAAAVRDRYVLRCDLDDLARRPADSLGRAVHDHCAKWNIHPAAFPKRPNQTPGDYVLVHIENTHDIWHPVCGFESDTLGEIGLQAFYLAQFPNLIALLLIAVANLHVMAKEPGSYPRLMDEISRGWLLGKRAKPMFGVRWDEHWDRPLADVRRDLGIDSEGVAEALAQGARGMELRLAALA